MQFTDFIVLAYLFGPAVAMPYGLTFMSLWDMLATLIICYSIPLPAIFYVLKKMDCEECSRPIKLMKRAADKPIRFSAESSEWIVNKLIKRFGNFGYVISIALLSFALGYLWATIVAYFFKFERKYAYLAIVSGTAASLLFWSTIAYYSINVISPSAFLAAALLLSIASFGYGKLKESQKIKATAHRHAIKINKKKHN